MKYLALIVAINIAGVFVAHAHTTFKSMGSVVENNQVSSVLSTDVTSSCEYRVINNKLVHQCTAEPVNQIRISSTMQSTFPKACEFAKEDNTRSLIQGIIQKKEGARETAFFYVDADGNVLTAELADKLGLIGEAASRQDEIDQSMVKSSTRKDYYQKALMDKESGTVVCVSREIKAVTDESDSQPKFPSDCANEQIASDSGLAMVTGIIQKSEGKRTTTFVYIGDDGGVENADFADKVGLLGASKETQPYIDQSMIKSSTRKDYFQKAVVDNDTGEVLCVSTEIYAGQDSR